MTDKLRAECILTPFPRFTVLLLTLFSMMTVQSGETYPSRFLKYTPYAPERSTELAALRVLREMDRRFTTPAPHSSAHQLAVQTNLLLKAGFPRGSWWWYPEMPPPQAKKRQNFSSYNWNSFGLRYGK